jgi:hypothetical protein
VLDTSLIDAPCPRFLEFSWDFENGPFPPLEDVYGKLEEDYPEQTIGGILDVVLTGSREQIESVTREFLDFAGSQMGLRRVNPPIKRLRGMALAAPAGASGEAVAQAVEGKGLLGQLEAWLQSGRAPLEGLDAEKLLAEAAPILGRVRCQT